MKKLIFAAAIALCLGTQAWAQLPEGARQLPNGLIEVPMNVVGPHRADSFDPDVAQLRPYVSGGGGLSMDGNYGFYTNTIAVLVDRPQWKSYTLVGLGTSYLQKDGFKNMTLWTSSKLWDEAPDGQSVTQPGGQNIFAMKLPTPIVLDGSKFYVGMTYEVSEAFVTKFQAENPQYADKAFNFVGCLNANFTPGTWIHREQDGSWVDQSHDKGSVNYYCYLQAPADKPLVAATVATPKSALGVAGKPVMLGVPLTSAGIKNFATISYEIQYQGQTITGTEERVHNYPDVSDMGTVQFMINLPAVAEAGTYPVTFKVTSLTDESGNVIQNNVENNEVTFDLEIREKATPELPKGVVESRLSNGESLTYYGYGSYYYGNSSFSGAMKLQDAALTGMKIVGAKISNLRNAEHGNYALWVSSKIDDNTPDGERVYGIRDGSEMTVLFENPVELPEEGIYVGATLDILKCTDASKSAFPLTGPKGLSESLWFNQHGNGHGWDDFSAEGAVPITVYLVGELPDNSMDLGAQSGNTVFAKNVPFTLHFEAANAGGKDIESINYTYQFGDEMKEGELTFDTPIPTGLGAKYQIDLPLEGIDYEGVCEGNVTIDLVNGKRNQSKKKMQTLKLQFVPCLPVKRPLFEEGTGTECGNCPRGMLAVSMMKQSHPGEFVAAAYHRYNASDPMYFNGALPWGNNASDKGFPNASIDRNDHSIDPYFGSGSAPMGVENDWLKAKENAAPASLEMTTSWDENKQNLTINTTAKFYYTEEGKTYEIGYILTADGLSEEGNSSWEQHNYYADPAKCTDSLLMVLSTGDFDVNTFNDVVLTGQGYAGVSGSVPADVKAGDTVNHTYSYDVSALPLAAQADALHVIAFLRDSKNVIYNAREVEAGQATTPDPEPQVVEKQVVINDIVDNASAAQYYDLMGRRVMNPQQGIFIKRIGNQAIKIVK